MAPSVGSILAGYRFLAWLFPVRPIAELTTKSYEDLCREYRRRDFWGNWLGMLVYLLVVAAWFVLMLVVGEWLVRDVPKQHFVGPFEFLYLVAAFFLSLFSSGSLLFLLYRLALGKKEYDLYMAYGGEKVRRSAIGVPLHFGKAFGLFFWVCMPPLLLLMIAYMDCYSSFTDEHILLNPFWSLGRRVIRPYSDVREIYEVRKVHQRDNERNEPYQVIIFTDRTYWETDHGSLDPKLQKQRDLMAFIATKSGQPFRKIEFFEDISFR